MQVEQKSIEEIFNRLGGIEDCLLDLAMGKNQVRKLVRSTEDEEYLTVEEASAELKISKPSLYKWMHAGKIPYYRIGSRVRFKRSEIFGFQKAKISL